MPSNKDPSERLEYHLEKATGYRYTLETKEACKADYIGLMSLKDIAEKQGIPLDTIRDWAIKEKWDDAAYKMAKRLYGNMLTRRRADVEQCATISLSLTKRGLQHLDDTGHNPTIREILQLTKAVAELDRIIRLDEGKPTDITEKRSLKEVKRDIVEIIKEDPFGEFEEAVVEPEPVN